MPSIKLLPKLTKPLILAMATAVSAPLLLSAPEASATKPSFSRDDDNVRENFRRDQVRPDKNRRDNARPDRNRRDNTRPNRQRRDHARTDRSNREHARPDRQRRDHTRPNRNRRDHARTDRNRRDYARPNRSRRDHARQDRHRRDHARQDRHRRDHARRDRHRRDHARRNVHRPHWSNRHNGYRLHYRSSIGINFSFGQPGYSRYRWASSPYSFYQPRYSSYWAYKATTFCERVLIEANHQGHRELISVQQCSNPYDGTYIIQGSEQIVNCSYRGY